MADGEMSDGRGARGGRMAGDRRVPDAYGAPGGGAPFDGGTLVAGVIVVAGGRSTRFGSDKLRHRIHGRTLLERTVAAAATAGPVVLVTAGEAPEGAAVDVVVSEFPRWGGPCAAVAAGLDAVDGPGDVLVVPADLAAPTAALDALTSIAHGVLTDADGHPQWLLARAPVAWLRARLAGLRSSHPDLSGLPASALFRELPGRYPVPAAACADIDTPADLAPAFPTSSPQRPHVSEPGGRSLRGLDGGGAAQREEFVHGTV